MNLDPKQKAEELFNKDLRGVAKAIMGLERAVGALAVSTLVLAVVLFVHWALT